MAFDGWSTHTVEPGPAGEVVKRFREGDRSRCEREWRALTLLAEHAPGLAPEPFRSDLAAAEPVVVMSRLPGEPLRGRPLDEERTAALAVALDRLYTAVPADVLSRIPPRPGRPRELVARLRSWAPTHRPRVGGEVGRAMDLGLAWLDAEEAGVVDGPGARPVFGPGDGNPANHLWDGSLVRIVDFEESGLSDRAFELAEITEHVGSWVEYPLDVRSFLGRFAPDPAESVRLARCRRLLALVWLFMLAADAGESPRNPPGTAERQAARLLDLLARPADAAVANIAGDGG